MKDEQPAGQDPDFTRVVKACEALIEHYDSVQILVTRHEPNEGGTRNTSYGLGNYFARKAHMEEWIVKEDEETREAIRARMRKKE